MPFPNEESLSHEYLDYVREREATRRKIAERSGTCERSATREASPEPEPVTVLRADTVRPAPVHVEQIGDGSVDEDEVPTGEVIHDSVDAVLGVINASSSRLPSSLATFARARLRALLMDPHVRDPQLVAAAKALLKNNSPQAEATASAAAFTVFCLPSNDRGPAPHGKVFYVRAE